MANHKLNRIKIHRSYTIEEFADLLGIHENTVSTWIKNGLPCLKEKKPFLILGNQAKSYLKNLKANKKQGCKPNELYCLRCKTPTQAALNFVEYTEITKTKGRLSALCIRCEGVVNRFASLASLERYKEIFDLSLPKGLEHINDSEKPLLNSDFKN